MTAERREAYQADPVKGLVDWLRKEADAPGALSGTRTREAFRRLLAMRAREAAARGGRELPLDGCYALADEALERYEADAAARPDNDGRGAHRLGEITYGNE